MRKAFMGQCLACVIPMGATAVSAEDLSYGDFDYDALVEELPIESEVFGPVLTFTSRSGAVTTFYGQVNLTYQSFADGEKTTSDIVDNGNWNSRLGFTYTQPIGENTLRFRFETGLTMRNSGLVSQDRSRRTGPTGRRPCCAGSRWRSIPTTARSRSGRAPRPRTGRRGWTTASPSSPVRRTPPTASVPSASATTMAT